MIALTARIWVVVNGILLTISWLKFTVSSMTMKLVYQLLARTCTHINSAIAILSIILQTLLGTLHWVLQKTLYMILHALCLTSLTRFRHFLYWFNSKHVCLIFVSFNHNSFLSTLVMLALTIIPKGYFHAYKLGFHNSP